MINGHNDHACITACNDTTPASCEPHKFTIDEPCSEITGGARIVQFPSEMKDCSVYSAAGCAATGDWYHSSDIVEYVTGTYDGQDPNNVAANTYDVHVVKSFYCSRDPPPPGSVQSTVNHWGRSPEDHSASATPRSSDVVHPNSFQTTTSSTRSTDPAATGLAGRDDGSEDEELAYKETLEELLPLPAPGQAAPTLPADWRSAPIDRVVAEMKAEVAAEPTATEPPDFVTRDDTNNCNSKNPLAYLDSNKHHGCATYCSHPNVCAWAEFRVNGKCTTLGLPGFPLVLFPDGVNCWVYANIGCEKDPSSPVGKVEGVVGSYNGTAMPVNGVDTVASLYCFN